MPERRRIILAGIVGNVLEWYDFGVYGYFAPAIGRHFFPSDDPTASLIAAFGVFAVGFLMRPLGGLVFGHIADRHGRNPALVLSVLAMAVPTCLIGLLPGHAQIGIAAPIILVVLRALQGLSVGGEYTTSLAYLAETAPPGGRGLAASWGPFGATAGMLLGSAVGWLVSSLLPETAVNAWGWRLPFLAGLAVGVVGLFARQGLPESPHHLAGDKSDSPLREALRAWPDALRVAALIAFIAVGFYLAFVFSVTYLEDYAGMPAAAAFDINTLSMVVLLIACPVSGWLSDRLGRRPILLAASGAAVILAWPFLWLMHHPNFAAALVGQIGFALLIGLFGGTGPAAMAEALPPRVRCTTISFAFNSPHAAAGGTTPLVAAYLIHRTADDLSPAYYLAAAAAISCVATLTLPRR